MLYLLDISPFLFFAAYSRYLTIFSIYGNFKQCTEAKRLARLMFAACFGDFRHNKQPANN
jgi:hypothetical protein